MMDFLRNLTKSAEEKQQEQLTAYLDNALPPRQRQQFEQELAQNAQLQAQVEQQRRLKEQLRGLARRRVPRNFTLDLAKYGRPQSQPLLQLYPTLRVATALNALFLIAVLVLGLLNSNATPTFNVSQEQAAAPVAMEESAEFDAQSEAAIAVTMEAEEVAAEDEGATANDATESEPEVAEEMPVEEAVAAEEAAGEPPTETNGSFATTAVSESPQPEPTFAAAAGETADLPLAAATSLPPTPTPLPTATSSSLPHNIPTPTVEQRAATEMPGEIADGVAAYAPSTTTPSPTPPTISPLQRPLDWLPVLLTTTFVILLGLTWMARRRL